MNLKTQISKLLVVTILITSFFGYFGSSQAKAAAAVYTWEKFNVERTQEYQASPGNYYGSDWGGRTVYPSITVDKKTGVINLVGESYYSENSGYYYYGGNQVVYRYLQRDSCDNWENCYTETYGSYFVVSRLVDVDVKGVSTGTYVTSTSPYTYPDNRKHSDGYWYVSKGLNSAPALTINAKSTNVSVGIGQDLILRGTVSDAESDSVTISATLPVYNITKSVTVSQTASAKNWELKWTGTELNGDNKITEKIQITANDQKGGIVSDQFEGQITVDRTAPTAPSIVVNPVDWTDQDVQVIVAAGSDALSGINKTEYRLGNGSWVTYTMPLTISSEGVTTVTARSVDNAGNKGAESTAEAKIVKSPPTTPVIILQSGGWTPGPVAFEITGSTGYGDFKYEYSIDDGPFTEGNSGEITKEGTSTITARAVNIFGQQSAENNEMVTIDHTEPTVNVTPNGHDWSSEAIKVDVTVSDDLSGIKPNSTYYKITSSPEQPHDWEVLNDSEIVISAEGQWYIHVKATDNAGNTTMYSTNSFKIQNQPVAPVGVKAINVQNDQVTVSWDLPDGSIYTDGYVYELTNNTTGATFQKVYPENSATDLGVTGGKTYEYTLLVKNHVGQDTSTNLTVVTKPDAPDRLDVQKIDQDYSRAQLTISPVTGAESYHIVIEDINGNVITDETVYGDNFTITGLQPGSLNNIKVSALNIAGEGPTSTVAYLALPGSPGGFTSAKIDEDAIELQWDATLSAEYYNLDRFMEPIYTGNETRYLDAGLQPGTIYSYRLNAENETGTGDYAELNDLMTLPSKPGNVAISSATSSSITLQWAPVQGSDSYKVSIDGHEEIVYGNEQTFANLNAGTEYNFSVVANNKSGDSQSVSISGYTKPDQATGIEVTNIEESSADVSWDPVYGADKYLVQVNGTDYEVSSPTINLKDLDGSRVYELSVWAGNNAGYGTAGSVGFLTKPHAPSNLTVKKLTSNSISLGWDLDSTAKRYRVDSGEMKDVLNPEITFENLDPGKAYQFELWTENETGESLPSRISVTTKTLSVNPEDIIIEVQHDQVKIEFKPVENAKEYILLDEQGTEIWRGTEGPIILEPIVPGKEYDYDLVATNDQGAPSSPSQVVFIAIPGAPDGIKVSSVLESSISFDLSNANKKGAEAILIYRDGMEVGKASAEAKVYTDKNLKAGTKYRYEFKAINASGISKIGIKLEATTLIRVETGGSGSGSGNGTNNGSGKIPDLNDTDKKDEGKQTEGSSTESNSNTNGNKTLFNDIENSFAKNQIIELADRGILKGTSPYKFEPDRAITRMEFVSMIVRALDISSTDEKPFDFDDIDMSKWYAAEFRIAWDNEITHGFNAKEYRPNALINREQASKMLGNVLNTRSNVSDVLFIDGDSIATWAKSEVTGLTKMQLVTGYPDGSFRPKAHLTREEGAALIYRSMMSKY